MRADASCLCVRRGFDTPGFSAACTCERVKFEKVAPSKAELRLEDGQQGEVDVSGFTNEGSDHIPHATGDCRWVGAVYHRRPGESIVLGDVEEFGAVECAILVCDDLSFRFVPASKL